MVSDPKIISPSQTSNKDEPVINVSFPYDLRHELPEAPEATAVVKIDYTAIDLPTPKKTIPIRRSNLQTRLVRIDPPSVIPVREESLSPNKSSIKRSDDVDDALTRLSKSVDNVTQESSRHFASLAESLNKQSAALPKLDALQKHFDQSHKIETANQRLFDAMHVELKGYKDNFLFDALQKPVIRDLVAVFDDLCGQARRVARYLNDNSEDVSAQNWKAELQSSHNNINNTVFYIIEVLNRLDVSLIEADDTILDLKAHKVVGVEPARQPEEQNQIARVVRPGFMWKDRVLRPTEVIVKKVSASAAAESSVN